MIAYDLALVIGTKSEKKFPIVKFRYDDTCEEKVAYQTECQTMNEDLLEGRDELLAHLTCSR